MSYSTGKERESGCRRVDCTGQGKRPRPPCQEGSQHVEKRHHMINVDGGAMMAPDSEFGKGFTVLNTNLINPLLVRTFAYAQTITLAPNDGQEIQIPITVPEGYIFLCVTNVKSNGEIAYSYYTGSVSNVLTCFVGNDRNEQKIIPQGISADVLFMKKWW